MIKSGIVHEDLGQLAAMTGPWSYAKQFVEEFSEEDPGGGGQKGQFPPPTLQHLVTLFCVAGP